MRKLLLSMAALPLVIGGLSVTASADDGINILDNIKVKGEIRPRYESADTNNAAKDSADAYTVRTHLVATASLFDIANLTATIGLQSVNNFGSDKYNSTRNGQIQYDVVADPQQAMLSEASVDYKIDKTALHAGRSQVNLDNQRFIGTVGWRQNERSYDSIYAANNSIDNLSVLAAWVYGYQGVVGTAASTTQDTNTILLHAAYTVMPALKVTAYDYMIANFHDTYGLALTGKVNLDAVKLNYRAEYALQKDATMEIHTQIPTTGQADADYINLDLGANINGILAGVNYEVLSGQAIGAVAGGDTAFSTPLATGHKFNGWADTFLTTPSGGLQDTNVRLGYKAKGFGKLLAVYHDFIADKSMTTTTGTSDDLGSEIDVVYVNKIPGVNGLKGMLKYANYSKGANMTGFAGVTHDTTKFWAMLDYKFSTK